MADKMSYLDGIKRMGPAANPFFLLMGIDVCSFGNGQAELSMEVRPDMLNGAGWLQGGLYTALCDEAMALALFTSLREGECIATISESTSYLQGVRGGKILAIGKVIKKGRHVAFTEGYVRKETDVSAILSQTRASFMIIGRPDRRQ
jgi:acyl-CoA thioesterase